MSYSYKGILYKYLVNNGVELDKDVYFYGLTAFMNYFLYFVILLPFAIIFDIFFEILVFLIFLFHLEDI